MKLLSVRNLFTAVVLGLPLAGGCSGNHEARIERTSATVSRFQSGVEIQDIKKALEDGGIRAVEVRWHEPDTDYPYGGRAELWSMSNAYDILYEKNDGVDENKIREVLADAGLLLTDEEFSRRYEELKRQDESRY